MNLVDIRKHFRTLSGRYDLVDDDVSGTTNMLINQACRYLDRITEHQKSWGSHFVALPANGFQVSIPYCRSIKEVWISNSTSERWQLHKENLQDLILTYLNSDQDPGTPLYYSPVVTRKVPADTDLSAFSAYMQYLDTMTNLAYDFNGIVIVPPASQQMLIEVRGFFYSKELVEETDVNHWTVNHPLTLVKAVMRELEIFNQNQSKVEGWDKALLIEIDQINKDLVSEVISEVDNMELKDEEDVR
jgi:hypothetical protein